MRNDRPMKSKLIAVPLALLLLAVLVLSACSSTNNNAIQQSNDTEEKTENALFPVTIPSNFGDVTITKEPKRIVATNYYDNVLALGLTPVGIPLDPTSKEGVFPYLADKLKGVENVGDANGFNLEKIISLSPDLIVGTSNDFDEQQYKDLSKIAPVLLIDYTKTSWQDTLLQIGQAMGKEVDAQKFLAEYQQLEDENRDKIVAGAEGKGIMFIMPYEKNFIVWGPKDNFDVGHYLYRTIGLTPAEGIPDGGDSLSLEGITKLDPEIILLSNYESNSAFTETDTWKSLRAVKNNQVYLVDKDFRIKMYYPLGVKENLDELIKLFVK